jgi:hypothetical protein
MNEVTINNEQYFLLKVDEHNYKTYVDFFKYTICNTDYITNFYEVTAYSLLEEPNYIGLFLLDNTKTIVHISLIINTVCEEISDKIKKLGYPLDSSVEITLLCSNYKNRIPGLAHYFLTYVINNLIPIYKEGCEYIFLIVAQGNHNKRALSFYDSIGFQTILHNSMIIMMMYKYEGVTDPYINQNITTVSPIIEAPIQAQIIETPIPVEGQEQIIGTSPVKGKRQIARTPISVKSINIPVKGQEQIMGTSPVKGKRQIMRTPISVKSINIPVNRVKTRTKLKTRTKYKSPPKTSSNSPPKTRVTRKSNSRGIQNL